MTVTQEMVMTLFLDSTIDKVKLLFKNNNDRIPIESFDMSFRLFKPSISHNINLELLTILPIKNRIGEVQETVMFFQPVGFFTQGKNIMPDNIEITVLREFESDYDFLIGNNNIVSANINVKKMSLEENAVIAAFSMDTFIKASNYEDASLKSNGLDVDIFICDLGYPQAFLHDRYGLYGHIAAYLIKEQGSIKPSVNRKESFDKLYSMGLLSAFKRV